MKRAMVLAGMIGLAACQAPGPISIPGITRPPASAEEALEAYYRTLPDEFYPRGHRKAYRCRPLISPSRACLLRRA